MCVHAYGTDVRTLLERCVDVCVDMCVDMCIVAAPIELQNPQTNHIIVD